MAKSRQPRAKSSRMRTTRRRSVASPSADRGNGRRRLPVNKTYKIYIGGKFPRTESGHYYELKSSEGTTLANVCRCTKKDLRDAVQAARAAQPAWAAATAFNRGQILYRVAEMLEGRKPQFADELQRMGHTRQASINEVELAIDRCVYYAGWADKYQQVFSSVNPVASAHFNFSIYEPTGVVGIVAPEDSALLGLVSSLVPAIVGGNTALVIAAAERPLCAVTFAEVLHASDVPGGVVNVLTAPAGELLPHLAGHMDVNAVVYCGDAASDIRDLQACAAGNVKRAILRGGSDWSSETAQGPYEILETQEVKTTWHPIGT